MKKKDYETLAAVLKDQYRRAQLTDSPDAPGMCAAVEAIARQLSGLLSVDTAAFLTACGIRP